MKIYPKIDWVSHANTVITGPGGTFEPARMPMSNVGDGVLSNVGRILSNSSFYTWVDIDFGETRALEGITIANVNAVDLSALFPAQARVIATNDTGLSQEHIPASVSLLDCTGSVGDIDEDPNAGDANWLVWTFGDPEATVEFGVDWEDLEETSEVRLLVASSDGTERAFSVRLMSDSGTIKSYSGNTVTATAAQGGELFTFSVAPFPGETGSVTIMLDDSSDNSGGAVLGAMRLYSNKTSFSTGEDSGWIRMYPTGLGAGADLLDYPTNFHHVFSAEQTVRYVRVWIRNHSADYLDIGAIKAGEAVTPYKEFALGGTSYGTDNTGNVRTSQSGQPYPEEGTVRDRRRFNLHFLRRSQVHELRMHFDRVEGVGKEFTVIPDETDPDSYFHEAVYGRMESLQESSMKAFAWIDSAAEVIFERVLEMTEVSID